MRYKALDNKLFLQFMETTVVVWFLVAIMLTIESYGTENFSFLLLNCFAASIFGFILLYNINLKIRGQDEG